MVPMILLILAIIILIVVIFYTKREQYFSCRDCPLDAQWPTFTTQDLTVLNPYIWPYSALPVFKGSSEKFTGEKTANGVRVAVEEHMPANSVTKKADPSQSLHSEPDHAQCVA